MALLDRPEQDNEGLRELFSRKPPWDKRVANHTAK